jgi:hypothetical protein
MGMMPMMHQMMHESHESEEHKSDTELKLQMQGEMLKAMGEIMMKYGKLLAEESTLKE